jgi:hypothetical protein
LAVVVEGCAEHIRTKYMAPFVQVICSGIKHPQAHVRNAALYAVGQFSEHLQPDIDKYANDILPILFEYLSATVNSLASGKKVPRSVDRVFYALEMFCETMEAKLNPFVPALMEHFFIALNPVYPFHVKELALSAIGATGNHILYFHFVISNFKIFQLYCNSQCGRESHGPLLWSHHGTFKNLSQWSTDGGRNAPSDSSSR